MLKCCIIKLNNNNKYMQKAPIPNNEDKRLCAVRDLNILDTGDVYKRQARLRAWTTFPFICDAGGSEAKLKWFIGRCFYY